MICRLCDKNSLKHLIDFGNQPIVHNLLIHKNDDYDLYPFRLGVCEKCGFLQLIENIPPKILYKNYFTLSSWKKQPHVHRLIWLIEKIFSGNKDTSIIEIGCNDGTFLQSLKNSGFGKVLGIEPTEDTYHIAKAKGFEVINDFFNSDRADDLISLRNKFDIVVARQVLEHIEDLSDFLEGVRKVLKNQGSLLLEIPDSSIHIDYLDFSFWEEHVNYFTLSTITNLLAKHGFSIIHSESVVFSGKALIVMAKKKSIPRKNVEWSITRKELIRTLSLKNKWIAFRNNYQKNLKQLKEEGKEIAVYGCGCRSSTLVNFLSIHKFLSCYIDDQKEKQNYYVPGNLLPIYSRDKLQTLNINHVILGVNAENEKKVIQSNRFKKKQITYESALPPSLNLPEFWKGMMQI